MLEDMPMRHGCLTNPPGGRSQARVPHPTKSNLNGTVDVSNDRDETFHLILTSFFHGQRFCFRDLEREMRALSIYTGCSRSHGHFMEEPDLSTAGPASRAALLHLCAAFCSFASHIQLSSGLLCLSRNLPSIPESPLAFIFSQHYAFFLMAHLKWN